MKDGETSRAQTSQGEHHGERQGKRRGVYDHRHRGATAKRHATATPGARDRLVCERRFCGEKLQVEVDALGKVAYVCAACERNRRGFCRDCPSSLAARERPTHSLRCASCAAEHERKARARHATAWNRRNRERHRSNDRHYYERHKPTILEARREAHREAKRRVLRGLLRDD